MPHVTPMFPAERPVDDQNIKCIRGGVATSGSLVSKTAKHTLVGVLKQVTIACARDRFTHLGWLDGNKTNAIVALRRFAFDLRFWCLGRFFLSLERLNALGVRIVASLLVGSFPSVLSSIYHSISPKSTYLSAQRCSQNRCLKSTCRHLRVCRSTILVQNWHNEAAWSRLQQEPSCSRLNKAFAVRTGQDRERVQSFISSRNAERALLAAGSGGSASG